MKCPECSSPDAVYQMFSGGREGYCPKCNDYFLLSDMPLDEQPRAALLQTKAGRIRLKAEMDQELARLRDQDTS